MRAALLVLLLLALGACSTLPDDGPSSRSVPREAARSPASYALIDLDYGVTEAIAGHPARPLLTLAGRSSVAPANRIAEGDVLAVSVFEQAEGGLFSSVNAMAGVTSSGATVSTLPGMIVDLEGNLAVPYIAPVHVAGLTPLEASRSIALALSKRTVDPQVTVSVVSSSANSVTVIGEVKATGRFLLTPYNDRLLDVLASAGGPTKNPADLVVVVGRGAEISEIRLSQLMADPVENIRLRPMIRCG